MKIKILGFFLLLSSTIVSACDVNPGIITFIGMYDVAKFVCSTNSRNVYYGNGKLAGSIGYNWYHDNGTIAGSEGRNWYHRNGKIAGSTGRNWYHSNGHYAGSEGGGWYYSNGKYAGQLF